MPFFELFKGYPFPGAFAKFTLPPGPDDWQPKAWGITGQVGVPANEFIDNNASFITDGIAPGDIFYAISGDPPFTQATTVLAVIEETFIALNGFLPIGTTNVIYKTGMKAPHTLQTLAKIIATRGLNSYTLHWNTLWTQAPFIDFNHTQLGDVYVCHD